MILTYPQIVLRGVDKETGLPLVNVTAPDAPKVQDEGVVGGTTLIFADTNAMRAFAKEPNWTAKQVDLLNVEPGPYEEPHFQNQVKR